MILIIAEKPNLARIIAQALNCRKDSKGILISKEKRIIVDSAIGHLLELSDINDYPDLEHLKQKKGKFEGTIAWWNIPLPFKPNEFKLKFSKQKANAFKKEKFKHLENLVKIHNVSEIVHFGDPDREGQIIIDDLIKLLKTSKIKKITRVWQPALEKQAIQKAFASRKDNSEYVNLKNSGIARRRIDWLLGVNTTIFVTNLKKKKGLFSVGRLQVPIVKEILEKNLVRANFKERKFYVLKDTKTGFVIKSFWDKENERIYEKEKAKDSIKVLNNSKIIVDAIEKKEKILKRPLLHNLTGIQKWANNVLGMSAKKTLEECQKLYEQGYISYPRTDNRYIPPEEKTNLANIILQFEDLDINANKTIFKKSDSSHSALCPTLKIYKAMDNDIYNEIFRSFNATFFREEAIIKETIASLSIDDYKYELNDSVIEQKGYLQFVKNNFSENKLVAQLEQGQKIAPYFQVEEKKTTKPKLHTEASLLSFLNNPFKKEVSNIAIGTPATQGIAIEIVISRGYVERIKKNLEITLKGKELIKTLEENQIDYLFKDFSIEMQKNIEQIALGKVKYEEVIKHIYLRMKQTLQKEAR